MRTNVWEQVEKYTVEAERFRREALTVRFALERMEKSRGKCSFVREQYERHIEELKAHAVECDRLAARLVRDYAGALQECA